MKKLLLSLSFLLLVSSPVYALIVTENVDRDEFQYEVTYQALTEDLSANVTATAIPFHSAYASGTIPTNQIYYAVVPRDGVLVGMSVSGNAACTAGGVTFDATINNQVTGMQTIIEPTTGTARSAVGISGAADPQYAYIRQDRASTTTARGFRKETSPYLDIHNAEHPYGKVTQLSAGNRVGIKVTTSSGFLPVTTDYLVILYVLE
jgi:hypothetical protein